MLASITPCCLPFLVLILTPEQQHTMSIKQMAAYISELATQPSRYLLSCEHCEKHT